MQEGNISQGELTEDDELAELAEEDLSTDQILALAEAEEQRYKLLESQKREEEELLCRDRERQEAIHHLKTIHDKRETLEGSLAGPYRLSPGKVGKGKTVSKTIKDSIPLLREEIPQARWSSAMPKDSNPGELRPFDDSNQLNEFAFQLLDSVRQLKDGNSAMFSALMAKTMADSSQIPLAQSKNADSLPNVHFDTDGIIRMAHEIQCPSDNVVEVKAESSGETSFKNCSPGFEGTRQKICRPSKVSSHFSSDESLDCVRGRSHKLKSGKTTKPDEAGITCMVQYAHEKLDSAHVKNCVFNDLSFHFLVAGELNYYCRRR